jgi:hypothetical protein
MHQMDLVQWDKRKFVQCTIYTYYFYSCCSLTSWCLEAVKRGNRCGLQKANQCYSAHATVHGSRAAAESCGGRRRPAVSGSGWTHGWVRWRAGARAHRMGWTGGREVAGVEHDSDRGGDRSSAEYGLAAAALVRANKRGSGGLWLAARLAGSSA